MNQLFIIGNGFDLAHGLKTSYRDFILWYLDQVWKKIIQDQEIEGGFLFKDNLLTIKKSGILVSFPDQTKICDWQDLLKRLDLYSIGKVNPVISDLMNCILGKNGWADIEKEYFILMKATHINNDDKIKQLNDQLDCIKKHLHEYLKTSVYPEIDYSKGKPQIESIFTKEILSPNENALYLNFNYTNTLKLYDCVPENSIINIHGKIRSEYDNLVFGYGDEMDESYKGIENRDENEYLTNIKTFAYLENRNYRNLINTISTYQEFKVHLLGHSLGLSDRLLLNTIFEHKNCKEIELHYYKYWEGETQFNNFNTLVKNLSIHFNAGYKSKMRLITVPFSETVSMN